MTLRVPLRDIAELSKANLWRGAVPEIDVQFALQTGMSARDVNLLRTFSAGGAGGSGRHLLVVRCPKRAGLVFQGVLPPKPQGIYDKKTSNISGTMNVSGGQLVVSDIDLMSIWRGNGERWEKVFCPGPPPGGDYWGTAEADQIMKALLPKMDAPFDHGCNDDFHSQKNQGVESGRYAAFFNGIHKSLGSPAELRDFYNQQGIGASFPYGRDGKYTGVVK